MGWASEYIACLQNGDTVQFRPRGNSMKGKIESGQLCTVVPVNPDDIQVDVLEPLHLAQNNVPNLVKARQGERFQIGNNRGHINEWIGANGIYGKCVRVE